MTRMSVVVARRRITSIAVLWRADSLNRASEQLYGAAAAAAAAPRYE